MTIENRGWFYTKFPDEGGHSLPATSIFELRSLGPLPELAEGQLRVRLTRLAIAPNARTYLELPGNDTGAEELGLQRTALGSPLPMEYIAEVVESRSASYAVGDRLWGMGPLFEYLDMADDGSDQPTGMPPMKVGEGIQPEHMLSVITPSAGITAYCAVEHHPCGRVAEPFDARTVLITSAAGAVGLVAGQLYQQKGCRVIGVTSSREKADRLEGFGGYDAVIAYRTEDLDQRLVALAPDGIDVFIDNVGADQLDAGLRHMKIGGTILSVGVIAETDGFASGQIRGCKEYLRLPARELTWGGFLMYNHIQRIPEAAMALGGMLARGELKSAETIVEGQFEDFASCVDRVYGSQTFGRLILSV